MTDVATKNWYIVHTYSGFEKKVAESLAERKQAYGLGDEIGETVVAGSEARNRQPSGPIEIGECFAEIAVDLEARRNHRHRRRIRLWQIGDGAQRHGASLQARHHRSAVAHRL